MSEAGTPVEDEPYEPEEAPQEASWDSDFSQLSDDDVERFARAQGWRPLSQYRGEPGGWQDARNYLRIGQDQMPILRSKNRQITERMVRVEDEVSALRRQNAEQLSVLQELRERARTADDRGYQRALRELKDQQRVAVESGDAAEVTRTTEQIVALETARAEVPATAPKPAPAKAPAEPPEVVAFRQRNPWVGVDRYLTGILINVDEKNCTDFPEMPMAERLEKSLAEVKRMAPDYFPGTERPKPRPGPTPVQPGVRGAPPRGSDATKIDSIADLAERAEARKAFERYKKVFADYTEAEYMRDYSDPHREIDVVTKKGK